MSYCADTDIFAKFGTTNVTKWADLDSDQNETTITARITAAINAASDDVDAVMLGGPYSIPIVLTGGGTPGEITNICAVLAGVWLYDSRGVEDYDAEQERAKHKLAFHEDSARAKLAEYRASVRRIPAVSSVTSAPYVRDYYKESHEDADKKAIES